MPGVCRENALRSSRLAGILIFPGQNSAARRFNLAAKESEIFCGRPEEARLPAQEYGAATDRRLAGLRPEHERKFIVSGGQRSFVQLALDDIWLALDIIQRG